MSRVLAAHSAGDAAEVTRLPEYARAEGDSLLVHFLDQRLSALRSGDSAALRGEQMAPFSMALVPGSAVCDFCAAPNPAVSYGVDEFGIDYPGGTFLSGDRFLACPRCRELVDAEDWKGLLDWIGPNGLDTSSRAMLFGFKAHRRRGAVELAAEAGPEEQLS